MQSHAIGHFPQVRFDDGQKWLFNPVLKKRFSYRPEERVRLQYVEFLLRETAITKNRIGFEALVKAYSRDSSLRADLVIYSQDVSPMALIECKSGRIKLSEKTAEQAARYNLTLQADFLMITNGQNDFWYKREGQSVSAVQDHPFRVKNEMAAISRTADYWTERGFLDSTLKRDVAKTASTFLNSAFNRDELSTPSFLNLPSDISPVPLNHFYRIEQYDSGDQLAFTLAASESDTILAAMLNRDGQNKGVVWISLPEFLKSHRPAARRLTPQGETEVTIPEEAVRFFKRPSATATKKFGNHLIILFD